jgi:hypothetical protein
LLNHRKGEHIINALDLMEFDSVSKFLGIVVRTEFELEPEQK